MFTRAKTPLTVSAKPLALTALTCCMLSAPLTKADTILGIFVGTSQWQANFSGDVTSSGPSIDLEDQLDQDGDSTRSIFAALEHPIPMLPNIKVRNVNLDASSSTVLTAPIIFDGVTYNSGDTVTSNFDLSHNNYIFYYELLDNWVNLDLGMNFIDFDGEIALESPGKLSSSKIDETIPTLYAKAQFDFPATNFYVGVEMSTISDGDNSLNERRYNVGYESDFGFGAEAGYRSFSLKWDDIDNSNGDLNFDGYYASVYYHF
jgi:outer membrane protein